MNERIGMSLLLGVNTLLSVCYGAAEYVDGEVLVLYRTQHSRQVQSLQAATPGRTQRTFEALSRSTERTVQWIKDSNQTTEEMMAQFSSNPDVAAVSPNYVRRICTPARFTDDPQFPEQWGLHNTGQSVQGITGLDDADIDYPEARRLMLDSPGETVIAIIDTGVDYTHPDLAGSMWVNDGEIADNGIDDDHNGYVDDVYGYDFAGDDYTDSATGLPANDGADSDPMDILDHGTHVAGIAAAAANNSLGISGAGTLKVMALKASADGDSILDGEVLSAMNYALTMKSRGVPIVAINASYGGLGFNAVEQVAIQALTATGIVFCAAAGNDAVDNDQTPQYPSGYNTPGILSIAATDSSDGLADFSNYGITSVDLAAPGKAISSCWPVHWGAIAGVDASQAFSGAGLAFSATTPSNGVSGLLYNCGIGSPSDFAPGVAGNVALIERGVLYFTDKVANAMAAGAVATIIYNKAGETELVRGNLMRPNGWIPSVGITRSDGLVLGGQTGQTVTVVNRYNESTGYIHFDGTSMSCPLVAGCIGVLAQHFPDDTVAERIHRLTNSVDAVAALASTCVTGGRVNLARSLDSDQDQLPDWWELQYAPDLATMNGTSNTDTDPLPDLAEYRTGTDPTASTNHWALEIQASSSSESGATLRWPGHLNGRYRVLATPELGVPFQVVVDDIPATPPSNAWSVPPTNTPTSFYKVESYWD
jgi:subtilisin family serine protease